MAQKINHDIELNGALKAKTLDGAPVGELKEAIVETVKEKLDDYSQAFCIQMQNCEDKLNSAIAKLEEAKAAYEKALEESLANKIL